MLTEPDDMDMYILALAEDGFTYAWQYQRTFPEKSEIRTRLTRKVLEWCFTRKSHRFKSYNHGLIRYSQATSRTPETIDRLSTLFFRAVASTRFCSRATSIATGVLHSLTTRSRLRAFSPVGTIRGGHQA